MEARSDRFAEAEDRLAGYRVYEQRGEKIGKVGNLFVDDLNARLEYISVKTEFFYLRSILVPADVVRIDDECQLIEVSQPKDKVKNAPSFEDLEEITAEFEREVRIYFGLESAEAIAVKPSGDAMAPFMEHHR